MSDKLTRRLPPPPAALAPLSRLVEGVEELAKASSAPNTQRAYGQQWRAFTAWCEARGVEPLPTKSDTLLLYLAELRERWKAVATVEQAVSAIVKVNETAGHPSPKDARVKAVMAGYRRIRGTSQRKVLPIAADVLRRLLTFTTNDSLGTRDRAMLLVGFFGALRRSEVVAIEVEHLKREKGGYVLEIPKSKTDPEKKGQRVALGHSKDKFVCPVTAIEKWLRLLPEAKGPLFREVFHSGRVGPVALQEGAVAKAVKRMCRQASIDPKEFSSHSMRRGFVTESIERGFEPFTVMNQTRHKSLSAFNEYVERRDLWKNNAAVGLLDNKEEK